MSYEGYEQHICKNGHLFGRGAFEESAPKCSCGAESVFCNCVDDTNFDEVGYIDFEPFKLAEAVTETCEHCGHTRVVSETTYRVPTKKEVRASQTYLADDGNRYLLYPEET